MRKALIILLLFCMTFLFSCSSENSIFDSNNSNVVIKGKVNWTDYGKNIHGARHAKVRIWNDEVLFNRLVTEVIADENGYYEISSIILLYPFQMEPFQAMYLAAVLVRVPL